MKEEEFVKEMSSLKPTLAELLASGYSIDEAREFQKLFEITRRSKPLELNVTDPYLRNMFGSFDLSAIEVGMVRFENKPLILKNKYQIGYVEGDLLMVDEQTNEIYVEEMGTVHVLWNCAREGESFFNALSVLNQYFEFRASNEENYHNMSGRSEVVSQCCELAGGVKYRDFYLMMTS